MELLRDAAAAVALFVTGWFGYRVLTKSCWACDQRLHKWAKVCHHCGRAERTKRSPRDDRESP
jgi:rRNA maturation endonuclease Nob1